MVEASWHPIEVELPEAEAAVVDLFLPEGTLIPYRFRAHPARLYRAAGKRALDILIGGALLLALLPVMVAVALGVLISSGRPLLYASQRAGRDGEPITVWKFRTMVRDADRTLQEWLAVRSDLAEEFVQTFKLIDDPRVTPFGRFLRKSSLDELPQLWNVLRGDMSLVGPRPVSRAELETKYGVLGAQAFAVRPGLTGLWQVNGRSSTSYAARVRYDCEYAAQASLLLDLRILFLTIPTVLLARGAG